MLKWMKAFGVGQKTGIDFPGEIAGIVPGLVGVDHRQRAHGAGGGGVAARRWPSVYATIANGGVRVTPHLVSQIGNAGDRAATRQARDLGQGRRPGHERC